MEINSFRNPIIDNVNVVSQETDKKPSAAETESKNNEDTSELATVNGSLLRAYNGLSNDVVSKTEVFDYLRNKGIKNEDIFENVAKTLCNKDGVITTQAFNYLKSLLAKTNIFRVQDYFTKAKDENGINYKALKALDSVLAPASRTGATYFCDTLLSDLKDKKGLFNDDVIQIVSDNCQDFQKAYKLNQTVAIRFFRSLKTKDGMFDEKAISCAKNELKQNKVFYNLTEDINAAKDDDGKFSPEKYATNTRLKSLFSGYMLNTIKSICTEQKDSKSVENFINFADSIKQDSYCLDIIKFINNIKKEHDSNIGLDYNQESYEFLHKFENIINFKSECLKALLKSFDKPISQYSEKETDKIHKFLLTSFEPEIVSATIEAAKINEGKDKGKVDFSDIDKAQYISNKTNTTRFGEPTNGITIKELAKALEKEEDSDALDFIYNLYKFEFEDKNAISRFLGSSSFEKSIDNSILRTITKYLFETDNDGTVQHRIDKEKIEALRQILPQNADTSEKERIQKSLFLKAFDLPDHKDNGRTINTDIEDLCYNTLQNLSGKQLKEFRNFLKKTFDSTSGIFFVDKNKNINSRVDIATGNALNPKTVIYDLNLGKAISETYEIWNNGEQTKITSDLINNTDIEQNFEMIKLNNQIYKELKSQTFKKYDESGNLIFTESLEKSPVDNVYNIKKTYSDGRVEHICKATKTAQGTEVIEKETTSFDGTKSYYRYEDDAQGNRILDYKIIDENGKTLMNQSVTFEVIDENHFASSRNGKSYNIEFKDDFLVVTNQQTNESAKINIPLFTKNQKDKILPILKQLPGEELFKMKELNLQHFSQNNSVDNAQYTGSYTKEIITSDDFNELAVILHEWGHGKDDLMFAQIKEKINNDPKLNEIYNYERDLFRKNLSDAQMSVISYFTADSHYLGAKAVMEGIAETNTVLNVSPKNRTQSIRSHYWQQYFPKTIAYLANLLN